MSTRVLFTGAAGRIGRSLRAALAGRYRLRLLDIAPQEPAGPDEEIVVADLADLAAAEAAMEGVDAVVHLAAQLEGAPAESMLRSNVAATFNVFEASRRAGVGRVVFASSNHVVGFYPVGQPVGPEDPVRPDTLYGVSKVFGEALGRLYADKYGLEVACLRIGTFAERPRERRHLSTWISPRDLAQLVERCLDAASLGFLVVYGISANARRWWHDDAAERLGYRPVDDAESFTAEVEATAPPPSGRPADRLQGGPFVEMEDF